MAWPIMIHQLTLSTRVIECVFVDCVSVCVRLRVLSTHLVSVIVDINHGQLRPLTMVCCLAQGQARDVARYEAVSQTVTVVYCGVRAPYSPSISQAQREDRNDGV